PHHAQNQNRACWGPRSLRARACFTGPRNDKGLAVFSPMIQSSTATEGVALQFYFAFGAVVLTFDCGFCEQAGLTASLPQPNARKRSPSMIFVRRPSITAGIGGCCTPVITYITIAGSAVLSSLTPTPTP